MSLLIACLKSLPLFEWLCIAALLLISHATIGFMCYYAGRDREALKQRRARVNLSYADEYDRLRISRPITSKWKGDQ